MIINRTRTLSFLSAQPVPEPEPGSDPNKQYAFVLFDYQLEQYAYKSRLEGEPWNYPLLPDRPDVAQGLPQTCKLFDNNRVRLNSKVAGFWFEILRRASPELTFEQAKEQWLSLTHGARYITNRQGWNNGYYDPISGTNDGGEPMGYEPIVTGGAIVEIIGGPVNKIGQPYYQIKAINPAQELNPDALNPETEPALFYPPTVIRRQAYGEDGTERVVNPFPQFNGKTITPIFSRDGSNWIPAYRIKLLSRGSTFPSPYNPPR